MPIVLYSRLTSSLKIPHLNGLNPDSLRPKFLQTMKILTVKVKPNSKQQSIAEQPDGSLTVHLKSPPVEGKANQELIMLLAKKFKVPKSAIGIKSGFSSRNKLVEIPIEPLTLK